MPIVPVTILTGFLGSGKTTLLNRILGHPAFGDAAVIVNEFGDVGIDHYLVEQSRERLIRTTTGCLCCTLRGDIRDTLADLAIRVERGEIHPFGRVIVETTGLADPAPVIHTLMFDAAFAASYMLGGMVATMDGVNGAATLDSHPESVKQAALADRIVITKTDIAGVVALEQLRHRISNLNPGAPVQDAQDPAFAIERLFDTSLYDPASRTFDVERWLGNSGEMPRKEASHGEIQSFSLVLDRPVSSLSFATAMRLLATNAGDDLLRVKGVVCLAEDPDHPVAIHGVQHVFHPPLKLDSWPGNDQRTRLVFITRNIPAATVETFFRAWSNIGDERAKALLGGGP